MAIVVWFAPMVKSARKELSVQVTGLDGEGVSLISPTSPGFDDLITKLMANEATAMAQRLKPYMVVVSNQTSHTVVAYNLLWKLTNRDGSTENKFVQRKYPDAVAGAPGTEASPPGHAISPGEKRLSAMEIEFGPEIIKLPGWEQTLRDAARNQAKTYADVTALEVELDAVIFDDGVLVGPDHGNLQASFAAYLEAKQKLFREIVAGLDAGQSMEQVFAGAKAEADVHSSTAATHSIYDRLAAEEILALRSRIGDQAVHNVFKQAIRKEPFVIHRRGPGPA